MKYLLDTTWVVEHLRGTAEVVSGVQRLQPEGLAVSMLSVAELYQGVFRSHQPARNEATLREFLGAVTVLDLTPEVCRIYGEQKLKLARKGMNMGAIDLLIAATALGNGLTLLSHDRDFERIADQSLTMF